MAIAVLSLASLASGNATVRRSPNQADYGDDDCEDKA
jgi:hypothetical protein